MTTSMRRRKVSADNEGAVPQRRGPGPADQFIHLRPALTEREITVLNAVAALPETCRTPTAAATALMLADIGIPYSSVAAILRRLEHKGALRLDRVKP